MKWPKGAYSKFIYRNMNKIDVLIVEDDPNLGQILSEYLGMKGLNATLREDGEKGMKAYRNGKFDLCILDVMMPKKDGFTLAQEIRAIDKEIPIIFLTAKSMKEDAIQGLKIGADDYITKPFSMEELLLRIHAIIRRTGSGDATAQEASVHQLGKYTFDTNKQQLEINSKISNLTTKESELLKVLVLHKNKTLQRTIALKKVWGDDSYFNARSMDVYIAKLRKLLKEDDSIKIISVHGEGFKLLVLEE